MKLKVLYEDEVQYLELDEKDTEDLWVSFSLEGEGLSQEEKEQKIQKRFDRLLNQPEYNNFHKETRHIGYSKAKEDEEGCEIDDSEPLMSEVADPDIFRKQELETEKQESYEEVCVKVRTILRRSPQIADAFIAVKLDGMSVQDYASDIGISDPNLVSKWLERAEKRLRKFFEKCQI